MSETLRMFIAVELPVEAKEALARVQQAWKRVERGVRWVDPDGIHLTLRFLGDVPREEVEPIHGLMARVAREAAPFVLALDRPGVFPNARQPRVLWVGLRGDTGSLQTLQRRIECGLKPLGFQAEERSFLPHLTVGRIRNPSRRVSLPQDGVPAVSWTVDHLSLMQSMLMPHGAQYTRLGSAPLVSLRGSDVE